MNTDPNKAKKYNTQKLQLSLLGSLLSLLLLCFISFTPLSPLLYSSTSFVGSSFDFRFITFITYIFVIETFVGFPLSFFAGYILEHRYELSNQSKSTWLFEELKSTFVSFLFMIPIGWALFRIVLMFPYQWWLIFGFVIFFLSILLSQIAPVLVLPLFYKIIPLDDPQIIDCLQNLCKKLNVKVEGVFTFDLSKNTKKANAALTGIGKFKRIILGDTLLEKCSPEQIETIFAHEVGHLKLNHVWKMLATGSILSFGSYYVVFLLFSLYNPINNPPAQLITNFPLLLLLVMFISFILSPLQNAISRLFERQADRYALEVTKNPKAFISAMETLAETNLADLSPHPFVEFWFYSHPSIPKRIEFAKKFLK